LSTFARAYKKTQTEKKKKIKTSITFLILMAIFIKNEVTTVFKGRINIEAYQYLEDNEFEDLGASNEKGVPRIRQNKHRSSYDDGQALR
jgi:hypothetical protein